jgi:hypothetical protein
MEGRTGMAHLLKGDGRETHTIERSFLAGETERYFVFESFNLITRIDVNTVLEVHIQRFAKGAKFM